MHHFVTYYDILIYQPVWACTVWISAFKKDERLTLMYEFRVYN